MAISMETTKIIGLSECYSESKTLSPGTLLKWMDIISCLAAEKWAGVPCVTVSVDDLQIDRTIHLGEVVTLKAVINRVFNTSMEVEVSVTSESLDRAEVLKICKAFFFFVTQRNEDGSKNIVKEYEPETEEEKVQFALANERKKMRMEERTSIRRMKESESENRAQIEKRFKDAILTEDEKNNPNVICPKNTSCECVEIVLPQHANHNGTTFGGQLMAWMEAAGTISARRLCRGIPRLLYVDEVFFKAISKVGDRIVISSSVNNTYDRSMEVNVRVTAYSVGGPVRHINSAWFTFIHPDESGNPCSLPKMKASDWGDVHRMMLSETRVKMRQERRNILNNSGPTFSVTINKDNQKVLCYKNIYELMALYNSPDFTFKHKMNSLEIYELKLGESLCLRLETELNVPPKAVYNVLADHDKRKLWDMAVTEVTIKKVINPKEDYVIHYVMQNLNPKESIRADDMVLLGSCREEENSKLKVIAYRSVCIDELPILTEYNRVENRCSGYIIQKSTMNPNGTKLTYINQLTKSVYKYVQSDLKGATQYLYMRSIALTNLIKEESK